MSFFKNVFCITTFAVMLFSASYLHAFEINGFGDVVLSQSNDDASTAKYRQFSLGQADFYIVHNIDDQLDLLLEYVVESNEEGEWVIDLERIQIGYYFNDLLKIRAGRFHKEIGYWNPTYHHAAQLHLGVNRPQLLEFEDEHGIIPSHTVGLWASGTLDGDFGSLYYDLMLGNGSKLKDGALDPNNTGENNFDKEISLNINYEPYGVIGSGVGAFVTRSKIEGTDALAADVSISQLIFGGDVYVNYENLEFLTELYMFDNENELGTGDKTKGMGYYAQAGITFGLWTPYLRYENLSKDDDDPYFAAVEAGEYTKKIAGVRYNIHNRSSLKLEGDFHEDKENDNDFATYKLQWAFLF